MLITDPKLPKSFEELLAIGIPEAYQRLENGAIFLRLVSFKNCSILQNSSMSMFSHVICTIVEQYSLLAMKILNADLVYNCGSIRRLTNVLTMPDLLNITLTQVLWSCS